MLLVRAGARGREKPVVRFSKGARVVCIVFIYVILILNRLQRDGSLRLRQDRRTSLLCLLRQLHKLFIELLDVFRAVWLLAERAIAMPLTP